MEIPQQPRTDPTAALPDVVVELLQNDLAQAKAAAQVAAASVPPRLRRFLPRRRLPRLLRRPLRLRSPHLLRLHPSRRYRRHPPPCLALRPRPRQRAWAS
ncbi:hypothetical protein [Lysobacter gummosus]|uniref:hypothetical protein n=1 Tax=Lysobacter gummosus TaxID=262324 RepID=UPI00363C473E